jgi:hypothetical protein
MPEGVEVTVPDPAPVLCTVIGYRVPTLTTLNVAVTDLLAPRTTVQFAPDVESHPVQLPKADPESVAATNVTLDPESKDAVHVPPQLIPPGEEMTVPDPVPPLVLKVTATALAVFIAMMHVIAAVASQPDQPAKVEPAAGAAVSVTPAPESYEAVHALPQSMPAGDEVTDPAPDPPLATARGYRTAGEPAVKVAVTDLLPLMTTVQLAPDVWSQPVHPANVEPAVAAGTNVTLVPGSNGAVHVVPQSIPAGDEMIVPEPVPLLTTSRVMAVDELLTPNVAVTVFAELIATVQVAPELESHPAQPENVDPAAAAAARVTLAPASNAAAQVVPQSTPEGDEMTVPLPGPSRTTVSRLVPGADVVAHCSAVGVDWLPDASNARTR